MITVEIVRKKIADAKARLDSLCRLPIKSDVDWAAIDDLKEYLSSLYENLGELKREEAMNRKYYGGGEE